MKCKRPTCTRSARVSDSGFCRAHYSQHLKRQADEGGYERRRVDATPAIEHINILRTHGLGLSRIAELTGLNQRNLQHMMNGQDRCYGRTLAKILAVPIPEVSHSVARDAAKVSSVGTVRRIRALIAMGYTCRDLAARLDSATKVVSHVSLGGNPWTRAGYARRVEALFNELHMTVPPDTVESRKAANRAVNRGWAPPLSWNEDEIDDPSAKPMVTRDVVERNRLYEYGRWKSAGLTRAQLAQKMGMHYTSFLNWEREHELSNAL